MAELLRVPEVAAGAADVVIGEWLVAPGDAFIAGQPIVVIETDKAVVEVEAEDGAVLLRPLVDAGLQAEVGSPLALLGSAEELGGDLDALLASLGVTGDAPSAPAPERRDVPEPVATAGAPAASAPAHSMPAPAAAPDTPSGRRPASPIARRLLREAGLSLEQVAGTGPGGRVTRRDVDAAIAQRPAEPTAPAGISPTAPSAEVPVAGWTVEPHSRLRLAVARRLTESKQQVPHFYLHRAARIDELLALRAQLNAVGDVKISVNDLVLRAVAVALAQVPEANVVWTDEALRRFDTADVAVAIASPRGLVTPVLRGVESMSLGEISRQVKAYAEQATAGRLQQRDLEGGSISVSNLGMYGVDEFAAIINPPHSAILAVGAGRREPVVEVVDGDERLVPATVMKLVLSVDHRAVDGALAAQWLDALVTVIESPFRLVL